MHILYCEDHPDTADLVKVSLVMLGHTVDYAQTADQAIQLFDAASPGAYDLIITDVAMPGHLGLVFADHARRNGYEGRIVVLTAYEKEQFLSSIELVNGEYWKKAGDGRNIENVVSNIREVVSD